MDPLHVGHLAALAIWAVLVVMEAALELTARTPAPRRPVARLHYWIDVLAEGPLLVVVLATGLLLTIRTWPPDALLVVKIACALVAVGLNAYCIGQVALRYRRVDDPDAVAHHGRRVLLSGLGIPPALVAAWIGATRLLR